MDASRLRIDAEMSLCEFPGCFEFARHLLLVVVGYTSSLHAGRFPPNGWAGKPISGKTAGSDLPLPEKPSKQPTIAEGLLGLHSVIRDKFSLLRVDDLTASDRITNL